jgi:creatinine amidohydrolase
MWRKGSKLDEQILMENMSWTEVKDAIEKGKTTVLVMVGSIEQHGPHLPLATDTYVGYAIGRRIAEKLGNALVAPVIRPGCSDHHMAFQGTISLRSEVLMETLRDYCRSLVKHGFKNIVIISTHGGNFPSVRSVGQQLVEEFKNVKIIAYADFRGFMMAQIEIAKKYGIMPERSGAHAGEAETSEMLAERPELVKMERAEQGYVEKMSGHMGKALSEGIHTVSKIGVLGDPTLANSKMGETYLNEMAEFFVKEIKRMMQQ